MFAFARFVARHKVFAIAIIALGVFAMTPSKEEAPKSTNPWAVQSQPATLAQADEGGFVDGLMTEASEFLDENGINPAAAADQTVGRFDDAATAYSHANK